MSLFFHLFTFAVCCDEFPVPQINRIAIYLWHRKFVTAEQTRQCLSTVNMVFSDKDKIFIKAHKYTQLTQLEAYMN